jgi:hypothetical protein
LENLVESDYLSPALKYKLEAFLQNQHGANLTPGTQQIGAIQNLAAQGLTSTPVDYPDPDMMILDNPHKKLEDTESKIDKYLTENLYYNAEHHQGKSNILEKEHSARIAARGLAIEKLGETVPIFIRELPAYSAFVREASFQNFSLLLNVRID